MDATLSERPLERLIVLMMMISRKVIITFQLGTKIMTLKVKKMLTQDTLLIIIQVKEYHSHKLDQLISNLKQSLHKMHTNILTSTISLSPFPQYSSVLLFSYSPR